MNAPATSLATTTQAGPQYEITDDDKARVQAIENAWKAYHGLLDPPLKKMPNQADDNVLSNRCQPIVDRGVDFLFGKPVELTLPEGTAQNIIDISNETWGKQEARIPLLQKLAMSGAMCGQAFLRIMPERNGTYRLIVVDPSTVFVQTAPQDCETVLLYCIQYSTIETIEGKKQTVQYREEISRVDPDGDGDDGDPFADVDASWQIQHWSRIGERGNWRSSGDPITWAYNFPPLFSCQNLPYPHSFWGMPDITSDLIGVNNSLNLVLSNINRVNKLYGQPLIYATGVAESEVDFRPGRIIGLPLTESKIVAVSYTTDLVSALQFADELCSSMSEQAGVPAEALGKNTSQMPRGAASGIAIELRFMPLLQKTEKKRCLYGKLMIDVSKALLVLSGTYSGDIDITLGWQGALPEDDLQSVQAAIAKKTVGVSEQTLLGEMGYDADEEQERCRQEYADELRNATRGQGLPPASYTQPGQDPQAMQQQPSMA
jgi:hypothetical protein